MPGLRFKFWLIYKVEKFPWVQVPAGEIGVVIAQVGTAAAHRREVRRLQGGVRQLHRPAHVHRATAGRRACSARCCLRARWCRSTPSPSWSSPSAKVYGVPVSPELQAAAGPAAG